MDPPQCRVRVREIDGDLERDWPPDGDAREIGWLSLIMKYINLYVDAPNIFFFFVFSILYRPYIVCAVCLTNL